MNTSSQSTLNTRLLYILIVVLLIGAFCLRIPLIKDRYFDPDELEHIQVASLISHGWVPHKDFFEHHNHLFHLFLLPLFLLNDQVELLFTARIIMQALVVIVIGLIYLLGKKLYSPLVGGVAALWPAFNYTFLVKTIEIRPDTPAMIFFLLAVLILLSAIRRGRIGLWLLAGFSFALALLCTQKIIFPILGVTVYLAGFWIQQAWINQRDDRRQILLQVASIGGGFLLPIGLFLLYFLREDALSSLIRENILINLNWQHRFSPLLFLRMIAFFNPYFIFWSGIGAVCAPLINHRWRIRTKGISLPYLALLGGILGAIISPVAYSQYYVLIMPVSAIYASVAIIWFISRLWRSDFRRRLLVGILLVLPIILPIYIKYYCNYKYDLPLEDINFWLIFSGGAITAAYLLSLFSPRRIGKYLTIIFLLAASLIRPINLFVHCYPYTNHVFLKYLKVIREATGSDDRVMDGWTGLGTFRFPAYYYIFLHYGVICNLTPEEKGEKLVKALEDNQPAIIVKDDSFYHLPPEISAYIERHYYIIEEGTLRGIPIRIYKRKDFGE